MAKRALVLGGTGMVGSQLVQQLVADPEYTEVTVLVRKLTEFSHPRIKQVETDYNKLASLRQEFAVDVIYCCLGTTIKKAGSREAFRQVDLDYPLEAAQLGQQAGAVQFAVVSSMGADEKSRFFYSRVKGELERRLTELEAGTGFGGVYIVRPSLLLGDRQERRPGEEAASWISRKLPWIWRGPLKAYAPVEAAVVAAAMRKVVRSGETGSHIYESAQLPALAASLED